MIVLPFAIVLKWGFRLALVHACAIHIIPSQDVSQDVHVDTSAHDDLLVALGGPRGFTVAPASTETTTTSSTAAPFTVPASAAVTTAVSSEPTQPAPFVPTKPPSSSPSKTKAPPAPPKALPAIPTRPSTSQPAASPSSSEEALDPLPQDSKQDRVSTRRRLSLFSPSLTNYRFVPPVYGTPGTVLPNASLHRPPA